MEHFTFFWGGPFSQWHKSNICLNEINYNCAEQYMMACKAETFEDWDTYHKIMATNDPKEQKALGRKVKNFHPEVWNTVSWAAVRLASYFKFKQNKDLLAILLATDGTTLVEASPFDKIWGIGLASTDARALNRDTWLGENRLGEILTSTRTNLQLEVSNRILSMTRSD